MKKETMMKILENPQSYNADERLTAARLALVFLDLIAVDEKPLEKKIECICESEPYHICPVHKIAGGSK